MNFTFNWSDVINSSRREILFEFRNKEYGAYQIRKKYPQRLFTALMITISIISICTITPLITGYLSKKFEQKKKMIEIVNLEEPPPLDKYAPPPPPPVEIPPVRQTIKFTPPIVVESEPDEAPPTQDEIKTIQVGTTTQEGEDIVELPPDPNFSQPEEEKIFTLVEEMPSFPGGERKLTEYLSHIHYPNSARENGIAGSVYLSFIVERDGKIKDAKVMKGIGGGCDEEALRVLLSLPDWNPGKQNGRPVPVRSTVRVNFTLK